MRDLGPDAQRPLAASDLSRQWQPFTPRSDVRIVKSDVKAPLRVLPVLHRCKLDVAPQIEGCGKSGGRGALQSEPMASKLALEPELDSIEHQLRRIALIVVPSDQRVVDYDLTLAEKPVGQRQFVRHLRGIDFDSRNTQDARAIAPDRESRPVDNQLL